jgi:hypothetical protein
MISVSAYSQLLETLYAAALDETQWKKFLEQLCASTGSVVALALDNSSTRGIQRLATNVTEVRPDIDAAYQASYRYTDPVRVLACAPTGEAQCARFTVDETACCD